MIEKPNLGDYPWLSPASTAIAALLICSQQQWAYPFNDNENFN
jgi:hypothetical protein